MYAIRLAARNAAAGASLVAAFSGITGLHPSKLAITSTSTASRSNCVRFTFYPIARSAYRQPSRLAVYRGSQLMELSTSAVSINLLARVLPFGGHHKNNVVYLVGASQRLGDVLALR